MKIQIDKNGIQEFIFRFIASNGEIVLNGEGYTTKQNCFNGIEVIRRISATNLVIDMTAKGEPINDTDRIEVFETKNNEYAFRFVAANNEIVGRSETYTKKQNAFSAILVVAGVLRAVKSNEEVIDLTKSL